MTPAPSDTDQEFEALPKDVVLNQAFIKPAHTILGLPLRPYAAGTEALLEQMRYHLRQRLNTLCGANPAHLEGCTKDKCALDCPFNYRSNLATYYFLGMFLFIHGADPAEVQKACWQPTIFFETLTNFLNQWRMQDVHGTLGEIAGLIDEANKAKDYKVEGGLSVADPNASSPAA